MVIFRKTILLAFGLMALLAIQFCEAQTNPALQNSGDSSKQGDSYADFRQKYENILNSITNAEQFEITTQALISGGWIVMQTNYSKTNVAWIISPGHAHNLEITSSNKPKALEHCANILRTAIDANQFNLVCSNLMNMPAVIQHENQAFRGAPIVVTLVTNQNVLFHVTNFVSVAASELDEAARLLMDSKLKIEHFNGMWSATVESSKDDKVFFYDFAPDLQSVQQIEERTSDSQQILQWMTFYDNGRLKSFETISPKSESFSFNSDGMMTEYSPILQDNKVISVWVNSTGKPIIRCFIPPKK